MVENPANYFKEYRVRSGFTNQSAAKEYLASKDIFTAIDYDYSNNLNCRIYEIVEKLNSVFPSATRRDNLETFSKFFVFTPFDVLKRAGQLPEQSHARAEG